jgi:hypothetical protein
MAGQIAPKNLFDLRTGLESVLLLGKLKQRNADPIFCRNRGRTGQDRCRSPSATTFLEDSLATAGLIAGAKLSRQEEEDVDLGWKIAKEIARLDIGQTVIDEKWNCRCGWKRLRERTTQSRRAARSRVKGRS